MDDKEPISIDSLVLYRNRPAIVAEIGKKVRIIVEGNDSVWVRMKDIDLLHPGPCSNSTVYKPQTGDVETAWELLTGQSTSLAEIAELAYGEYSPVTAWAAWQLVDDGLFFRGRPDDIRGQTAEEVENERATRAAREARKQAWENFIRHLEDKALEPEDEPYLQEAAELGLGNNTTSTVLRDLGKDENPETAHAFLLETGFWNEFINPYPARLNVAVSAPDNECPDLPPEDRTDLTHLTAFAIDDEGNQDPDDALSLEDGWLWVHVADAAALVPPGSPADVKARERSATLYLPEGTVPMLPEKAIRTLGLGLAETSPALSFRIPIGPNKESREIEIVPSWVRVSRVTYEEAEKNLEQEPLRSLLQLAMERKALRLEQGAVDIDLPEVRIKVEDKRITIQPLLPFKSRELVSEAMLFAGEAVARFAMQHKIPFAFATQPEPGWQVSTKGMAGMFEKRLSLQPSKYTTSPGFHHGLGLEVYAQATSPLRRYLDLAAHQQLRASIKGDPPLSEQEIVERIGTAVAGGRSVRKAEQLSRQHWTLVYLLQHPDWQGDSVLIELNNGRARLLIPELDLETSLYLRQERELNSIMHLSSAGVYLPNLESFFRIGE